MGSLYRGFCFNVEKKISTSLFVQAEQNPGYRVDALTPAGRQSDVGARVQASTAFKVECVSADYMPAQDGWIYSPDAGRTLGCDPVAFDSRTKQAT